MSPELISFAVQKRGAGVPWPHIAAMAGKPVSAFRFVMDLERGYDATKAKREAEEAAKPKPKGRVGDGAEIPAPIMRALAEEIASIYSVTVESLIGHSRNQKVSRARQHLMWALLCEPKLSTTKIGLFLGGRDHTTILYGAKAHARRRAEAGL